MNPKQEMSFWANTFPNLRESWNLKLRSLREFLRISESGLNGEMKKWADWYVDKTNGFSEEEKEKFIQRNYDELVTVRDTVPFMFRKAAFVMIVGYWEVLVADICRAAYNHGIAADSPKETLYLRNSRSFLMLLCQLEIERVTFASQVLFEKFAV